MPARIAVIYYSATGNVHRLAQALADGAEATGAEVRLRPVAELTPEMVVSQTQHWGVHRSQTDSGPEATLEDLEWADGLAFGSPTRFGNVAAQLKIFLDQVGSLWQAGRLVNKVLSSSPPATRWKRCSPPKAIRTEPPTPLGTVRSAPTRPRWRRLAPRGLASDASPRW